MKQFRKNMNILILSKNKLREVVLDINAIRDNNYDIVDS